MTLTAGSGMCDESVDDAEFESFASTLPGVETEGAKVASFRDAVNDLLVNHMTPRCAQTTLHS